MNNCCAPTTPAHKWSSWRATSGQEERDAEFVVRLATGTTIGRAVAPNVVLRPLESEQGEEADKLQVWGGSLWEREKQQQRHIGARPRTFRPDSQALELELELLRLETRSFSETRVLRHHDHLACLTSGACAQVCLARR